MVRTVLAAAILAGAPALVLAQSASAPLIVTATVVSTCEVDVPHSADASTFATFAVVVTCAQRDTTPQGQRPIASHRYEVRDAVLTINF